MSENAACVFCRILEGHEKASFMAQGSGLGRAIDLLTHHGLALPSANQPYRLSATIIARGESCPRVEPTDQPHLASLRDHSASECRCVERLRYSCQFLPALLRNGRLNRAAGLMNDSNLRTRCETFGTVSSIRPPRRLVLRSSVKH